MDEVDGEVVSSISEDLCVTSLQARWFVNRCGTPGMTSLRNGLTADCHPLPAVDVYTTRCDARDIAVATSRRMLFSCRDGQVGRGKEWFPSPPSSDNGRGRGAGRNVPGYCDRVNVGRNTVLAYMPYTKRSKCTQYQQGINSQAHLCMCNRADVQHSPVGGRGDEIHVNAALC